MKTIEVEIDGSHNESLSFRPLPGRRIRGRFDLNRVAEPLARLKTMEYPQPIPGQRLGIDAEGRGYVSEPLHAPENAPIRERIQKQSMRLPPEIEMFEAIDVSSWLFWLQKAVEAGVARLIKGEFPSELPTEPRKNFIMAPPKPTDTLRLTAAIERQNDLMAQLLKQMASKK